MYSLPVGHSQGKQLETGVLEEHLPIVFTELIKARYLLHEGVQVVQRPIEHRQQLTVNVRLCLLAGEVDAV